MADMAAHFFVFFSYTIWYSNLPYFIKYSLSFPPRTVFIFFPLLLSCFINLPYFTQYILSFLSSHSRFFVFLLVTIFFLHQKPSSFHKLHFLVSSLLRESDGEQPLKILLSPSANLPFSYYPDGRSLLPSPPPLPRSLFPLSPTLHLFRPFHSSPRRFPSSIPRSLTSRISNLAP